MNLRCNIHDQSWILIRFLARCKEAAQMSLVILTFRDSSRCHAKDSNTTIRLEQPGHRYSTGRDDQGRPWTHFIPLSRAASNRSNESFADRTVSEPIFCAKRECWCLWVSRTGPEFLFECSQTHFHLLFDFIAPGKATIWSFVSPSSKLCGCDVPMKDRSAEIEVVV